MTEKLDTIFSALADGTRRSILAQLIAQEAPVKEIAERFSISAPAVSRHLKVLENAGLINRRVEAQSRIISLNPEALRQASEWVDQYRRFWTESLDKLEDLLVNDTPKPNRVTKKSGRKTTNGN
jgi:DNA-binding transcriptional ArsR family regulator